jgi:hypothetical protein
MGEEFERMKGMGLEEDGLQGKKSGSCVLVAATSSNTLYVTCRALGLIPLVL